MKQTRNTVQKDAVAKVFHTMRNHPSAGMVYEAVHAVYPTISRATVFRILAASAEEGTIRRLKMFDGDDRYDFNLTPHYHTVCKHCGGVSDAFSEDTRVTLPFSFSDPAFLPEDIRIEISGVCSSCQIKK